MLKFFSQKLQDRLNPKHTLIICGVLSCFLYLYLLIHSQTLASASVFDFWFACISAAILSFCAWYHFHIHQSFNKHSLILVLAFAIVFRLIGFFTFPILEDDFYRFLWDGRLFLETGTPYGISPSAYFGVDNLTESFQDILGHINHPDVATIYGPVCQWLFALAYLIAPGELWPIKLFVLIADIALLYILIVLMRIYAIRPHFLILYAWCPLIIKEFVISVHPDIFAVLFLFAAILFWQRQLFIATALSLTLAVGSKIFAIVLAPLLLGKDWRRWLLFIVCCIAIAWPFGLREAWLPDGLQEMASSWFFNAPIYALLENVLPFTLTKLLSLFAFSFLWCLGVLRQWWPKPNKMPRGDIIFALFFLCLPAMNTWYLIWVLPFGLFYPTRALWVASVSMLLSYGIVLNDLSVNSSLNYLPNSILLLEYGLIVLAIYYDWQPKKNLKRLKTS